MVSDHSVMIVHFQCLSGTRLKCWNVFICIINPLKLVVCTEEKKHRRKYCKSCPLRLLHVFIIIVSAVCIRLLFLCCTVHIYGNLIFRPVDINWRKLSCKEKNNLIYCQYFHNKNNLCYLFITHFSFWSFFFLTHDHSLQQKWNNYNVW